MQYLHSMVHMTRIELARSGPAAASVGWLAPWIRQSYAKGHLRLRAVLELHRRLQPFGVRGVALVAGPWLATEARSDDAWRLAPWPVDAAPDQQRWAEGAGEVSPELLRVVVEATLGEAGLGEPAAAPRVARVDCEHGVAVVIDPSLGGRRPALVVLELRPEAVAVLDSVSPTPTLHWPVLLASGLLRADRLWVHWSALNRLDVGAFALPQFGREQPMNAQEALLSVAAVAQAWVTAAVGVFEVATAAVYLPDPEDEYVYALGTMGMAPHAQHAGLVSDGPRVAGVGFGLAASCCASAAADPTGSAVVLRHVPTRDAMRAAYRELGYDDEALTDEAEAGPFAVERFIDPGRISAARRGPWVFAMQRLPQDLWPVGRNLVLRLQGRVTDGVWCSDEERVRISRDRRERIAALAVRVHGDLCRLLAERLTHWRDGLRAQVLAELDGPQRPGALCRTLASWMSARAVSLWRVDGDRLVLDGWSRPDVRPRLAYDLRDPLDVREMRLLRAPLYPRRSEISVDGFLGWSELEVALGGPYTNVATIPVIAGGRAVGLLRFDGAMSLFGGHLRRASPHGALHDHRPAVFPVHLRGVGEEVCRLLALAMRTPPTPESGDGARWRVFVAEAVAGEHPRETIRSRVAELRELAYTRGRAAAHVGVHRNTFRRQLAALSEAAGGDVWVD